MEKVVAMKNILMNSVQKFVAPPILNPKYLKNETIKIQIYL